MIPPADSVRLDHAVVERGLVDSRTRAARAIAAGHVTVNGIVASKASHLISSADHIAVTESEKWVSRAAHKLEFAIEHWGIPVSGATVLDVGASTGGFTQVVLAHGAEHVIALDVGHDQVHPLIRGDARVLVVEGENARYLTAGRLGELSPRASEVSLVVSDVSFISLTLIIPALVGSVGVDARYVFLIKPQFEVGRSGIDDGIVRNARKRREVIRGVIDCAVENGLTVSGVELSPVSGEHGNAEAILYCDPKSPLDAREWTQRIENL